MAFIAPPPLRRAPATTQPTSNVSKIPPRPSSISQRSTLKRSIDDTNLLATPSSPTKRLRVKFDADVDIVSADDEDDLDPLVVNEQVRRAIERHLTYDHGAYERIRGLFTADHEKERAPSTKALRYHIQALEANVTRLRKECGTLVQSIIWSEWVGRDDSYVAAVVRFLGSLAVAQGGFVSSIMSMLVDLLGPQRTRRIPGCKVVRQPKIHKRVLETIRYMTQLVPIASSILAQRISSKLDFDFSKAKDRMTYVENFMQLIQYTPEVTSEILNSILQQLIKLDASVQAALEDDDEDAVDDILQHMTSSQTIAYHEKRRSSQTSSDEDSAASLTDESESEDEETNPTLAQRKQQKEDMRQVDMIMEVLFEYYSELMRTKSLELRDNAIEQLIAQFNRFILPMYRSRHPQFLIFHFAQTDATKVDRFLTHCLTVLLDHKYSPVIRHAAGAYLSGFVGRGKNVSPDLVHGTLDLLCGELNQLRLKYEPSCLQPDVKRYGDFYAMFQAVMYIFCMRWKDLSPSVLDAEDGDEYSDLEDEDQPYSLPRPIQDSIHAAIYSRLNPLRVCYLDIVQMFARLTHALEIFYLTPKLEENKRVRIATSWRSVADLSLNGPERDTSWVGENGMLEGHFPYDPYHLPISKHWVEGEYIEWEGVPGEILEDSEAEDEDEDDEEEFDMLNDVDGTLIGSEEE
ncbi:DNA independent RNA polymerase I transcription factor [Knufia obscura]|uniref:DNA independent RNA polymerase I transcription factor n=1 Tax=Knufia obscura TaxID=1635080 RepID=A0ABR0S3Y5_9EURO|nr:DNA independent RNA polymerase I transcription factor [Knufia obscura]